VRGKLSSAGKFSRVGKRSRMQTPRACHRGMKADIHGHYVRNYMLHMPFTHRSTLTMNTNRAGEGWREIPSKAGNINVDYLLGISLLGNNPISW
jgi:hypothetical protein